MANTPHGSWPGCPYFGLRELLEQSGMRQEKVQVAMDQINRALEDLGITNLRVEAMTRDSLRGAEVGQWTITLASTTEPGRTFSVGLGGKAQ
ncbi:MAG: hypothetical protein ACLP6G_13130 [Terriglobales bacterium]